MHKLSTEGWSSGLLDLHWKQVQEGAQSWMQPLNYRVLNNTTVRIIVFNSSVFLENILQKSIRILFHIITSFSKLRVKNLQCVILCKNMTKLRLRRSRGNVEWQDIILNNATHCRLLVVISFFFLHSSFIYFLFIFLEQECIYFSSQAITFH